MTSKPADASIIQKIQSLPEPQKSIILKARKAILGKKASIHEDIKWGNLTYSSNGNICGFFPAKAHVSLFFFRGADLPSHHLLLKGSGKKMRFLKFRSALDVNSSVIKKLVSESVCDKRSGPAGHTVNQKRPSI